MIAHLANWKLLADAAMQLPAPCLGLWHLQLGPVPHGIKAGHQPLLHDVGVRTEPVAKHQA